MYTPPRQTPPWADRPGNPPPGQTTLRKTPRPPQPDPLGNPKADTPPRQAPPWQTHPPPPEMATGADGALPTGMHSCLLVVVIFGCEITKYN